MLNKHIYTYINKYISKRKLGQVFETVNTYKQDS